MSLLRDIKTDLVEKRLWPIAALLAVALVAVPLLLGSSAPPEKTADTTASVPPAEAPPSGTSVVALEAPVGRAPLAGHAKDPFEQKFLPKPAPEPSSTTGAPAGGQTPSSGGGGETSGGDSNGNTGGGNNGGGAKKPVYTTATVDATMTRAGGRPRTFRGLQRLTPLPSSLNPILVFLGVLQDGRTAVFLVSSDAKAQGDGKCKPSHSTCQTVQLKAGQTEFFDLKTSAGTVQYELDLIRVRSGAGSARSARSAARAGRRALKAHGAAFTLPAGYSWDPSTGRLRWRAPRGHRAVHTSAAALLSGVAGPVSAVAPPERLDFGG